MKIVTANIGRNIGAWAVRKDMEAIKRNARRAIVGWQEIDEGDPAEEHQILRSVFGSRYEKCNFESRVPVTLPRGYNVIRTKSIFLHSGIPHTSPVRVATEVWIKHRKGVFVVINFHIVAGAWNNKRYRNKQERIDKWNEGIDRLRDRILYHHRNDRTVIWMGDTNRVNMPKLHPKERQIITAGIDSISVIEGSLGVKIRRRGTIKLRSDHNAKWIDFTVYKK